MGGDDRHAACRSPRASARYDQVLLDLDGCLWVGDEALEGAAEAVAALREAGKAVAFLTNDVRHAPEEFVRKLWRLGFQAALSEVVTVGAARPVPAGRPRRRRRVRGRLAGAGRPRRRGRHADRQPHASSPPAPTSSWSARHDDFDYDELRIATQAVLRGAELIGATRDATLPDARRPVAGHRRRARGGRGRHRPHAPTGSSASPSRAMYEAARDRLGAGPLPRGRRPARRRRAGARRAGMDSALVLTGGTTRAQADAADPQPTHVADSLAALGAGELASPLDGPLTSA